MIAIVSAQATRSRQALCGSTRETERRTTMPHDQRSSSWTILRSPPFRAGIGLGRTLRNSVASLRHAIVATLRPGLWTLPGCGKPWTASKPSRDASVHPSHKPLENRQTTAGFPRAPTGPGGASTPPLQRTSGNRSFNPQPTPLRAKPVDGPSKVLPWGSAAHRFPSADGRLERGR
jgi:hypothetical protein